MKRILLLLFITCALSCNSEDECEKEIAECNFDSPTEDLFWLKEYVESVENSELADYFYVLQGEYNGQPVFIINGNCCPHCDTRPMAVMDCNGNEMFTYLSEEGEKVSNEKVIWKTANMNCDI